MSIKFNSKKTGGTFEIIEGVREVFIETATYGTASTGTEGIKLKFKVRNDVDQPDAGRVVFNDIWYKPETAEFGVMNLLAAVGTPEDKDFNSLAEVAAYVEGKAIKVTLAKRKGTGQYAGKEYQDTKKMEPSDVGGGRVDNPFEQGAASNPFDNPAANTQSAPVHQDSAGHVGANGANFVPPAPTYNGVPQTQPQVHEDPFANSKGPIEVSEDDLPF